MGCFPKCFTACRRRKHQKSISVAPFKPQSVEDTEEVGQIQPAQPTKLEDIVKAITPIKESKEENEEQLKNCAKKKVTFDFNVKAQDESSSTKQVIYGLVEISYEKKNDGEPIRDSVVSSLVSSHPLNHRYENFANSEDEDEDVIDLEGSDLNEDGGIESKQILIEEESSESLFSLSIDSRKQVCDAEIDEKEVNSPMSKPIGSNQNGRDRDPNCQSVLNSIENLTQWKEEFKEKATPTASNHQEKENMKMEQDLYIPFSPEPTLKLSKERRKPKSNELKLENQGNGVDTSLSSWLVESETTPKSIASNNSVGNSLCERVNSPESHEDRPILGAWSSEELKQLSAASTPNRPRSPSPDEMPIIGTVGSYWNHTGQAMDSDSSSSCRGMPKTAGDNRVDQKVKWKSTPFEAKLERALDMDVLEV